MLAFITPVWSDDGSVTLTHKMFSRHEVHKPMLGYNLLVVLQCPSFVLSNVAFQIFILPNVLSSYSSTSRSTVS